MPLRRACPASAMLCGRLPDASSAGFFAGEESADAQPPSWGNTATAAPAAATLRSRRRRDRDSGATSVTRSVTGELGFIVRISKVKMSSQRGTADTRFAFPADCRKRRASKDAFIEASENRNAVGLEDDRVRYSLLLKTGLADNGQRLAHGVSRRGRVHAGPSRRETPIPLVVTAGLDPEATPPQPPLPRPAPRSVA